MCPILEKSIFLTKKESTFPWDIVYSCIRFIFCCHGLPGSTPHLLQRDNENWIHIVKPHMHCVTWVQCEGLLPPLQQAPLLSQGRILLFTINLKVWKKLNLLVWCRKGEYLKSEVVLLLFCTGSLLVSEIEQQIEQGKISGGLKKKSCTSAWNKSRNADIIHGNFIPNYLVLRISGLFREYSKGKKRLTSLNAPIFTLWKFSTQHTLH